MKAQEHKNASSLFLIRMWQPGNGDAQPEWSGRVVHITSGKASNFLHLPGLATLLLEMLGENLEDLNKDGAGQEISSDSGKPKTEVLPDVDTVASDIYHITQGDERR